ncbi:liver carboxylesterase [Aspergillus luchuensis IFO 4308]|nr:liver carboxylesterase [Aspergillus luchuensis IFO 4308]
MGKPIVAVSLNYRLHCWGFMWSNEMKEAGVGNLGLRDQRLALHWIQENIAAFGGDPAQVTIWGESAGANSVGTHLVAYGGRDDGIFRAAISESGAPSVYQRYPTPDDWQPYYDGIVNASGCSSATDTLACLRTIPTDTLHSIFDNTSIVPEHSISGLSGAKFIPVIDDDFIKGSGTIQLQEGKFVKVPYLIGANADEGTAFAVPGVNTDAEFRELVKDLGLDNATTDIFEALYPNIPQIGIPAIMVGKPPSGYGRQYKRVAAFQGDVNIHGPRLTLSVLGMALLLDPMPGPLMGQKCPTSFITVMACENVHWPRYNIDNPEITFFDNTVSNLSYVRSDVYRAEGIKYIGDHLASSFGE